METDSVFIIGENKKCATFFINLGSGDKVNKLIIVHR